MFIRLFDRFISSIICYIFNHKWDSPFQNSLHICERCGKVNFKK